MMMRYVLLVLLSLIGLFKTTLACEPPPIGMPKIPEFVGLMANQPLQKGQVSMNFFQAATYEVGCDLVHVFENTFKQADLFPPVAQIGDWIIGQSYGCDGDGCYDNMIFLYNTVTGVRGGCMVSGYNKANDQEPTNITGETLYIFGIDPQKNQGSFAISLNLGNTAQLAGYVYGCGSPTHDPNNILERWQIFYAMMQPFNRLKK